MRCVYLCFLFRYWPKDGYGRYLTINKSTNTSLLVFALDISSAGLFGGKHEANVSIKMGMGTAVQGDSTAHVLRLDCRWLLLIQ
jgi:hypothetical protein